MKKIWIIAGIIVLFLIVGYLYNKGVIKTDWQPLSILLAALAGPTALIQSALKDKSKQKAQKILKHQQRIEKEEKIIRAQYEALLRQKEMKIQELQAQLEKLQDQLDRLQLERKEIASEVKSMTLEEKANEFNQYFGD